VTPCPGSQRNQSIFPLLTAPGWCVTSRSETPPPSTKTALPEPKSWAIRDPGWCVTGSKHCPRFAGFPLVDLRTYGPRVTRDTPLRGGAADALADAAAHPLGAVARSVSVAADAASAAAPSDIRFRKRAASHAPMTLGRTTVGIPCIVLSLLGSSPKQARLIIGARRLRYRSGSRLSQTRVTRPSLARGSPLIRREWRSVRPVATNKLQSDSKNREHEAPGAVHSGGEPGSAPRPRHRFKGARSGARRHNGRIL
jgi:hypothetical protein